MAATKKLVGKAIVKMVQSGDQITVRSQPRGGPPKEKIILFSNLTSGKPARRAGPSQETDSKDEHYAWNARENLRKKIIGKEVYFEVADDGQRSYGVVYLGTDGEGENLTTWSLETGNAQLRDSVRTQLDRLQGKLGEDEEEGEQLKEYKHLVALEDKAKEEGVGRWGTTEPSRNITWVVDAAGAFIDTHRGKEMPALVEHIFNASMLRLYLPTLATYCTVSLAGIRAPGSRDGVPEEFFQIARFTVETRLLGRDVGVIIEGSAPRSGQGSAEPLFVGTIVHPAGNISELLLKEGYARCVDWSMGMITGDVSKYRNAEKAAKMARKRIWKNWEPADAAIPENEREFSGKVIQIVNSDSLSIDNEQGAIKQIFLSSIRPVRVGDLDESIRFKAEKQAENKSVKALYSVPYLFEAREFLRKKVIGKKVHVKVDYMRAAESRDGKDYPERACATVTFQGTNLAEALISRGLAVRIRHRQDDDNRSSQYDELVAAEQKAQKAEKGAYSKSLPPKIQIQELDTKTAKATFPLLKGKRLDATVDYVFSGSRLKVNIPKESCVATFLIGGIECPRTERPRRDGQKGVEAGDPCANEAFAFTRDHVQQRDVTIEIDTMDKVGGFVGYLIVNGINMSIELVKQGLSKVHYSGEQGKYASQLLKAQADAQAAKLNIWKDWEPPKEVEPVVESTPAEPTARNVNYEKIVITEVTQTLCFYGQKANKQDALEDLTSKLRDHFASSPPTAGAYKPKRNDICAAIFPEDGQWYRGKVEKATRDGSEATITFIDYGNRALVQSTKLAALPAPFSTAVLAGQANEYQLALVKPPTDEDSLSIAMEEFLQMLTEPFYFVNDEGMREGTTHQVTMINDAKEDLGEIMLKNGFCTTVKKAPNHLKQLHEQYLAAQLKAKKAHLNLWKYGDITEDDDKEFGMRSETVKK